MVKRKKQLVLPALAFIALRTGRPKGGALRAFFVVNKTKMRRKDMDVITNISGVIKGFIVVSSLIIPHPSPPPAGDIAYWKLKGVI